MKRPAVLFLYTELAPYFLAGVERLVRDHDVDVHIVRWPVNMEAPFQLDLAERVHVHERGAYNDRELVRLCAGLRPAAAFASGWMDKGYLKVCRELHGQGVPTVMCSDTAWRGDLRQFAAIVSVQLWLRRTFTHAWVTGAAQARYAHYLGFHRDRIRTGFYTADVDRFAPLADLLDGPKRESFPKRLLCVARYIPTKGHQLLCDTFAALCKAGVAKDWELWIAGTGELHEAVMNSPSGRHERIRHLGFVQAPDMPDVMAQCGVFVLPSTFEPWGVVVHEHAAAGFPLVLSDAVGAGERFLLDTVNGYRFEAGNGSSLAAMLRLIVESGDEELVAMGRESARLGGQWTPGDWANVVSDLMKKP